MSFLRRITSRRKKEQKERFQDAVEVEAIICEAAEQAEELGHCGAVTEEMRVLKSKISKCEEKLTRQQSEKLKVFKELLPYKQLNKTLPETLKRKAAKCKSDIQLTSGHLAILESKLEAIQQAIDNQEVIDAIESANKATAIIAPSMDHLENIMEEAQEQVINFEKAAHAFATVVGAQSEVDMLDDEEFEKEIEEFELEAGIGEGDSCLDVAQTKRQPPPKGIKPEADAEHGEAKFEREVRRRGERVVSSVLNS